jgi:hypothetical protein
MCLKQMLALVCSGIFSFSCGRVLYSSKDKAPLPVQALFPKQDLFADDPSSSRKGNIFCSFDTPHTRSSICATSSTTLSSSFECPDYPLSSSLQCRESDYHAFHATEHAPTESRLFQKRTVYKHPAIEHAPTESRLFQKRTVYKHPVIYPQSGHTSTHDCFSRTKSQKSFPI